MTERSNAKVDIKDIGRYVKEDDRYVVKDTFQHLFNGTFPSGKETVSKHEGQEEVYFCRW